MVAPPDPPSGSSPSDWFGRIPVPALLLGRDGRVLEASPAALRLTGRTRLRTPPPRFADWVDPIDRRELLQTLSLAVESGAPLEISLRLHRRDGTTLRLQARVQSGPDGAMVVLEDRTRLFQLEESHRRSQRLDAVGNLAETLLQELHKTLEATASRMERFASRLPLESRDEAEAILHAARLGSRRAARFQGFARPREQEPPLTDLIASVERALGFLRIALGEKIVFEIHAPEGQLPTRGTESQIEHVLLHLAVWGRERLPRGGSLRLELGDVTVDTPWLAQDGEWLEPGTWRCLRLLDSGAPMASELLDAALDPWPARGAPGLLASIQETARACGGNLRAAPVPGSGMEVVVLLPPAFEPSAASSMGDESRLLGDEAAPRILVVDDRRDTLLILSDQLQDHHYQVRTCQSSLQARELVAEGSFLPDLLVTDLDMPDLGGMQLATAVRERLPHLPVLFISGYGDPGNLPEHSDFLHKPLSLPALLDRIRGLL